MLIALVITVYCYLILGSAKLFILGMFIVGFASSIGHKKNPTNQTNKKNPQKNPDI